MRFTKVVRVSVSFMCKVVKSSSGFTKVVRVSVRFVFILVESSSGL